MWCASLEQLAREVRGGISEEVSKEASPEDQEAKTQCVSAKLCKDHGMGDRTSNPESSRRPVTKNGGGEFKEGK